MKPFKKNQTLILPRLGYISLLAVSILITSASVAQADTISSFLQQFQQVYNSLKTSINQYKKEFSQAWGELSDELTSSIESTIGSLGIPDPIKSGQQINKIVSQQTVDLLQTPPFIQGIDAERQWHQEYTFAQSQATLGADGQKIQAQEADMSNDALSTSSNNADSAQSDVVTQDILKKMATQNLQSTIIAKSIHNEEQKQTQALASVNMNLADISGRMDEQSRRKAAQANASARQVLEAGAFLDSFWEKGN